MCQSLVDMESLILWNESLDTSKLFRDFRIDEHVDASIRQSVLSIIKSNWDSFRERGVSHRVLDFEFVLILVILPPFVVINLTTGSTSGKLRTNKSLL